MKPAARLLAIAIAGIVLLALCLIPWHPQAPVRGAAGMVLSTLVLWITEIAPLGVVALWIPVGAAFCGLLSWDQAVHSWGDPIILLFLGAFLLARALDKHGVFQRLLHGPAARLLERGGTLGLAGGVLAVSGSLSLTQNNTSVTAMLVPAVSTVARRAARPSLVVLALAYGATLGGMALPIGTAPNLIGYAAMKKTDLSTSFISWMRVGVPVWIGASLLTWTILAAARRWRPAARSTQAAWLQPFAQADVGPQLAADAPAGDIADQRSARRWAVAAFLATAIIWLSAGIATGFLPEWHPARDWVRTHLPESLVPIAMSLVLFVAPAGKSGRTVLDRHDFQALDWDTLFLIAGGLTLGRILESSGAAAALAHAIAASNVGPTLLLLGLGAATVLLSELTSNTATASLMVPIAAPLAATLQLEPAHAIWLVALCASLGFALPVSTPPNAIVYGTRLVGLREMAAIGIVVDVVCLAWVVVCVRWLA